MTVIVLADTEVAAAVMIATVWVDLEVDMTVTASVVMEEAAVVVTVTTVTQLVSTRSAADMVMGATVTA